MFWFNRSHNGSDALGKIDKGTVVKRNGKVTIDLEINKRYITLGPIANIVGVAFELQDPDNLLEKGSTGVTLVLLDRDHKGLEQLTHHNPLDAGFPNGTLKGKMNVSLDKIIGGEENAGNGWKMLAEWQLGGSFFACFCKCFC